LEVAR
jgi:hypothetical protein